MNSLTFAVLFVFYGSTSEETLISFQSPLNGTAVPDLIDDHPHPTIIDGYLADLNEFPFAIRLYVHYGNQILKCTGQAVSLHLIITAAHCVYLGGRMIVVTGKADQTDYLKGKNVNSYARYLVTRVYVHPQFDPDKLMHDVALLKLGRAFHHHGAGFISPAFDRITRPENATIFGWGGTEYFSNNNKLYGKHLKAENCTYKPNVGHTYLCLMERGICHGDSGGGLIINGSLYGIASFHDESQHRECMAKHAYFYTALSEEESFVKDCIAKNRFDRHLQFRLTVLPLLALLINFYIYKNN